MTPQAWSWPGSRNRVIEAVPPHKNDGEAHDDTCIGAANRQSTDGTVGVASLQPSSSSLVLRGVARCAIPVMGADRAAPTVSTAPSAPTSRLSVRCPTSLGLREQCCTPTA